MALEIAPAPTALKPKITDLCRETYEAHKAEAPRDWPGNFFETVIQPMIDAAFTSPKGAALQFSPTLFIAEEDGVFAGYYRLSHVPTDPATEYFAVSLEDIYVMPEFRRKGVATAMIAHAKALAETHDWDSLTATVADWNAASRAIFEAEGFGVQSRKFAFGPDRAARDVPVGDQSASTLPNWLWIAGLLLILGFVISFISR